MAIVNCLGAPPFEVVQGTWSPLANSLPTSDYDPFKNLQYRNFVQLWNHK